MRLDEGVHDVGMFADVGCLGGEAFEGAAQLLQHCGPLPVAEIDR